MDRQANEETQFNGRTYRRYPHLKGAHSTYFSAGGGKGFLHRHVWEHFKGPIPAKHEIHHVDGNPANNDIANLECLTRAEHDKRHPVRRWKDPLKQQEHLTSIREMTKEWHASPEGLEWHRQHAKNHNFGSFEWETRKCDSCANDFEARVKFDDRFCSNVCKSRWRRASKVDHVEVQCVKCGHKYRQSRYRNVRQTGCALCKPWRKPSSP